MLKKVQHRVIEFVAVFHMRPMAAARKDMHACVRQTAQHEQTDIERAGAVVLAPDNQGFCLDLKQIEIKILGPRRAMFRQRDEFRIDARFKAFLDQSRR